MTKTLTGAPEPPKGPQGHPCDLHAERAVSAAVVSGGPLAQHLVSVLEEGDFTDPVYREIFAAAAALAALGRSVDPVAVTAETERRGCIAPAGMVQRLVAAVPPGVTAVHYGAIVRDLAALRRKSAARGLEGLPQIPLRGFLTDDDL